MKAARKPIESLPAVSIDEALQDRQLLGAGLGELSTWVHWFIALKAAFGRPLTDDERSFFMRIAGGRAPPLNRIREFWAIVSRRGGKSRMAAAIAAFIACFIDHSGKLAPGEIGFVLVLAASKQQAKVVHSYVRGFLEASTILKQLIHEVTADEIRLRSGIIIAVHPNSFRTSRGRTLLACIFDEVSFWQSDTTSSPDVETYRAILPSLATTGGMLVGISSPYRQTGLLYQKHQAHYGKEDPAVLVIQSDSRTLNPSLDSAIVEAAREADPESARAEWDGEFRGDLASYASETAIMACVESNIFERPWQARNEYFAFVDVAGGAGADSMCLGISHTEGKTRILDCLREARPPFSPEAVAEEFADVCKSYKVTKLRGDRYAGQWPVEQFKKHGINFQPTERTKSELYLHLLPMINSAAIQLLDNRRSVVQLASLVRRTGLGQKDSIDHPSNGHDDLANVVAGAMCHAPAEEERRLRLVPREPAIPHNEWDPLAAYR